MFYHVRISLRSDRRHEETKVDMTGEELEERILAPYRGGTTIVVNGRAIPCEDVERLAVSQSEADSSQLIASIKEEDRRSGGFVIGGPSYQWQAAYRADDVSDQFITAPPGRRQSSGGQKLSNAERAVLIYTASCCTQQEAADLLQVKRSELRNATETLKTKGFYRGSKLTPEGWSAIPTEDWVAILDQYSGRLEDSRLREKEALEERAGLRRRSPAAQLNPKVEEVTVRLMEDGHHSQAIAEAFKVVEQEVRLKLAPARPIPSPTNLMENAFGGETPRLRIRASVPETQPNEQEGYKLLFKGSMLAIRDPKAHHVVRQESVARAWQLLALASLLVSKTEEAQKVPEQAMPTE